MTPEEQLIEDIGRYCRDPLGFAKYAWPWGEVGELSESTGPRDWQEVVLNDIGYHLQSAERFRPLMVAVASGHGIGKSALISIIDHWARSTCEDCRVVVTANTEAQLRTKTWPEMSKWTRLAINSHWFEVGATTIAVRDKAHERVWRTDAIAWSDNNTEAFAGLHNKGKRIVVIYDEASAISDRIWEVTEGALTDSDTEIIWIAFGNPTKNTGRFRECFGRFKHRWVTRQIDSRGIEGTNREQMEKWVQDYGEDSDFVRVRVRGEFPRAGSSQFISGDVVADARNRDVGDQSKAFKVMSWDIARFGDDQTIGGVRQGLALRVTDKIRGQDTVQVSNRIIQRIIEEIPRSCVIDGDGIGGGVADYVKTYLAERWRYAKNNRGEWVLPEWFRLEEFHSGASPGDAFMYFNRRAEVWGKMRDWLVTGQIPDDPELASDLTSPEYFFSSKNQIQLERKEDMKKRGIASPDCGDMLAMSFGFDPIPKTREEALTEEIARMQAVDPLEAHFMRVRETERRQKQNAPMAYWE